MLFASARVAATRADLDPTSTEPRVALILHTYLFMGFRTHQPFRSCRNGGEKSLASVKPYAGQSLPHIIYRACLISIAERP